MNINKELHFSPFTKQNTWYVYICSRKVTVKTAGGKVLSLSGCYHECNSCRKHVVIKRKMIVSYEQKKSINDRQYMYFHCQHYSFAIFFVRSFLHLKFGV